MVYFEPFAVCTYIVFVTHTQSRAADSRAESRSREVEKEQKEQKELENIRLKF